MELHAPSHWLTLDVISDLHLQASEPQTFEAWRQYLENTTADAVLMLGDVFEVWVGDDTLRQAGSFEASCVEVMRQSAERTSLYLMHGNRDFLMGEALMKACNATLLPDPTVLSFGGERWLLTHGDELCVDDTDYQAFRQQVRSPQWQTTFLQQALETRLGIARQLRSQSEARKQRETVYADVDTPKALQWLTAQQASHLLHGHTHKPGFHLLDAQHDRTVLSDWDLCAQPPRAQVLRLSIDSNAAAGAKVQVNRLPPNAPEISSPRLAG
jgi:UDP-2,3-diacylglucosamine hydrolase